MLTHRLITKSSHSHLSDQPKIKKIQKINQSKASTAQKGLAFGIARFTVTSLSPTASSCPDSDPFSFLFRSAHFLSRPSATAAASTSLSSSRFVCFCSHADRNAAHAIKKR